MPSHGPLKNKAQVDESPVDSADRDGDFEADWKGPAPQPAREVGGPKGPDPVRYGDWERGGRCIDF